MKSFKICTPRQILGRLRCDDMCADCSMHGGEQNCIQSFRKQKVLKLIFHYLHSDKFGRINAWDIPGTSNIVLSHYFCIGLMHNVFQPRSLINTVTAEHRIIYIHRNLTVSQTFCIISSRENYHVTNTLTNTFIRLAAALIRKQICQ
jgi:hypothetical protein